MYKFIESLIQNHAATIATAHYLENLAIPVPVDHPMTDILDEVEPLPGMSGMSPLPAEGFTYPSKLGGTIYSQ